MAPKLPTFKRVNRLQRDKRYSNAVPISPDDSASQHEITVQQQYSPEYQYDGQPPEHGQLSLPNQAPIPERKSKSRKHDGHVHGQTMSRLRKWLLIISLFLLIISIVFLILVCRPPYSTSPFVPHTNSVQGHNSTDQTFSIDRKSVV